MRLVRTLDTRPEADDSDGDSGSERRFWHWYIQPRSADDEGSGSAATPQSLQRHLDSAEGFARSLAARLGLGNPEAEAVVLAARWHDLGKRRRVWQRSIGNRGYPEEVLAKPAGRMRPVELGGYRHELGSVVDLRQEPGFTRLSPETQDLVMHLVAAHHGRARPHFPSHEAFDPERAESVVAEVVAGVSRRFGQLQRRYGRWGLAYLESLVRAADALASSEGMP
jgi:CRISPR-associated endonuclease/helicase Cas3